MNNAICQQLLDMVKVILSMTFIISNAYTRNLTLVIENKDNKSKKEERGQK